jgi:hypothetical protein
MRAKQSIGWLLAGLSLAVSGIAVAQDASHSRTLVISGHSEQVPLIQVNGRSYVEVEALARAISGSLSFSGNQTVLTLPGSSANQPAAPAASRPGFSKGFLTAGIEQMSNIREWHTALASAIQNGYPVTADWLTPYRAEASKNLRLASVAVSTDSDRSAFQLLTNEFQNMSKLSDKYVTARANMNYIAPDALQSDDLNQRIMTCGRALGAMAASGQFVDDGSCN